MKAWMSGNVAGTGTFRCTECDYPLSLGRGGDALPACPGCGGARFSPCVAVRRNALPAQGRPMPPRSRTRDGAAGRGARGASRARVSTWPPGADGDQVRIVALDREWTRVGRSLAADVRFDDPTVSRRHALIVRQADGVRVLDDRSLNGVFVNGERVEWRVLADGDEIVVGRYRLHFLEAAVDMEPAGVTPLESTG